MKGDTFEIRIEKLIYGGFGLGRQEGKVVFVPFSVPGDRLLVRVTEEKKTFARAVITGVLEPGPGRVEPPCPYFGNCGGCQWQQLEYARQVEAKRRILEEILRHRHPGTENLRISMAASTHDYGYRSRARLQIRSFGPQSTVGFFRFQSHDVEDIEFCPLLRPVLNTALASVRESRRRAETPLPEQIEIAGVEETNSWAAAPVRRGLDETESTTEPQPDPPVLQRRIGEHLYLVSPAAFFQANDFMLTELTSTVMQAAEATRHGSALDLYCGAGLFTLPLSRRFVKVAGVDNSPVACDLAERNLAAAAIHNAAIRCTDVTAWMRETGDAGFDLVLLDPPRTGATAEAMNRIREWEPETIIYVSCNPQTLSRDLTLLPEQEYAIDFVQGFDLFPQTYHFETVVRLRRV